jgi:hypothetical protein
VWLFFLWWVLWEICEKWVCGVFAGFCKLDFVYCLLGVFLVGF